MPGYTKMPDWAKWLWYGPTWRSMLILGPTLWIGPLALAALIARLHGYAPAGWSGWWWEH